VTGQGGNDACAAEVVAVSATASISSQQHGWVGKAGKLGVRQLAGRAATHNWAASQAHTTRLVLNVDC